MSDTEYIRMSNALNNSAKFLRKLLDKSNKSHKFRRSVLKSHRLEAFRQMPIATAVLGGEDVEPPIKCVAWGCERDSDIEPNLCMKCYNQLVLKSVIYCALNGKLASEENIDEYYNELQPIEPFIEVVFWSMLLVGTMTLANEFPLEFGGTILITVNSWKGFRNARKFVDDRDLIAWWRGTMIKSQDDFINSIIANEKDERILDIINQVPPGENAEEPICRLCFSDFETGDKAFVPCKCSGSIKFVHGQCFKEYIHYTDRNRAQKTQRQCPTCLDNYHNAYSVKIS